MSASSKAFFFLLTGHQDNTLHAHQVHGARILPVTRHEQLDGFTDSGPLWLECQNYFDIPRTAKGAVCCFLEKDSPSVWQLGIVHRVIDTDYMEVYVWKDRYHKLNDQQVPNHFCLYPGFFFKSY